MASAIPVGGRAIGEIIRRSVSLERLRRAVGVSPVLDLFFHHFAHRCLRREN
jgi:hypothetical protein